MKAKALHSTLTKDGHIRLTLDDVDLGAPGPDEVIVRVDAAPVNPTDLYLMLSGADLAQAALTQWRVLSRASGRTRIELVPRTGRTHQLRVHCAHPQGLGAAIVGDRLYGRPAERLLLHAERLAFAHPHAGTRIELELPAPF